MSSIRIGVGERRARLAVRHHLAPAARAADVVTVARDLVALHATDPSTVYLAAWARLRTPAVEDVSRAIYDDRALVRLLGHAADHVRGAGGVDAGGAGGLHPGDRGGGAAPDRVPGLAGLTGDVAAWLAEVEDATSRSWPAGRGAVHRAVRGRVPG